MKDPIWFQLGEEEGVLELPPVDSDGLALELHVMWAQGGCSFAWWETEMGQLLGPASVGAC